MAETTRISPVTVSLANGVAVACGALILVAFLFLPWASVPDEGVSATGLQLLTDPELELPRAFSTVFLAVLPAVGLIGLVWGGWGMLELAYWHVPRLLLMAGVFALAYYYAVFLLADSEGLGYAGAGFWVALLGVVGLIVQFFIPHPAREAAAAVPTEPQIAPQTAPPQVEGNRVRRALAWARAQLGRIPLLAYLVGMVAAVFLEVQYGEAFARLIGFRRIPNLFGVIDIMEPFSNLDFSGVLGPLFPSPTGAVAAPLQSSAEAIGKLVTDFVTALTYQGARNPGFFDSVLRVAIYDIVVFVIPVIAVGLLLHELSKRVLDRLPRVASTVLYVVTLYAAVWVWGDLNDYRELVLVYIGINIMLTVSLNLVNGYMGEFSVGHAGFMAVGAYVASVLTMFFFTGAFDKPAVIDTSSEVVIAAGLIIALIAGGVAAALAGLLVAFPSFKTRGDYLAIVTLAVNFIVQGVINNMEFIGGPRGLNGVPLWTNLHWVLITTILALIAIHHLVNSTFGKGIIAIREDEIAADLMGVNTRRVKMVAFLVSSFIAGVAGGLFAHALAYVNPSTFGILKSTEVLVMVYLGGMGSISGSVIAAIIFTLLLEALRPLAVLKWVIIPLILIILMLYRPQGLFGFREMRLNLGGKFVQKPNYQPTEAIDGAVGD